MALALGLTLAAGCTSSSTAAQDVSITACTADPSGGQPTATGTIVNHSSKASTYAVSVTFVDSSGNKVSEGAATVGRVEAAGTATIHVQGVARATGPLTCRVSRVSRTVSP